MAGEAVRVERDGAIARIILDRPEPGNPVDLPIARDLLAAAAQCDCDASVRRVVLTGSGRMFRVGLSLAISGVAVLASRSAHFTAAYTDIDVSPDGGLPWAPPPLGALGAKLMATLVHA